MTYSRLILMASFGSAALLLGAFAFQYIGELAPCKMCLWQRWPHAGAILLGLICLIIPSRDIARLAALVVLGGAFIALYHVGVEQSWWPGPDSCTSGNISGLSAEELLAQILAAPVVRCDEIAWQMLGLSMAAWNGVISVGLTGIWLLAAQVKR